VKKAEVFEIDFGNSKPLKAPPIFSHTLRKTSAPSGADMAKPTTAAAKKDVQAKETVKTARAPLKTTNKVPTK
jgi:hypothetical protein